MPVNAEDLKPYRESLYQLFLQGPTYDGNVISKSQRDWLVLTGLAFRVEGYTSLTPDGLQLALRIGMDREKERRQREDRSKRARYDALELILRTGLTRSAGGIPLTFDESQQILKILNGEVC